MSYRDICVAKVQAAKQYLSIVVGLVATLILAVVIVYPYIAPHIRKKTTPALPIDTTKQSDLLQGYDWSHFAGAEQSSDGVHISPLGRAIVNQDGSPNQVNPPVNIAGPHLNVSGDFSITADVTGFSNVGSLQFYDKVPIIYDEWRYETPSLKISQANNNVNVDMWNGSADNAVLHKVFKYSPDLRQFTVARVGQSIVITVNGNHQLVSLSDNNVFTDKTVWFGADAALKSSGWTLTALGAQSLSGGTVQIVGSPNLSVAHNDPMALRNLVSKQAHPLNIGAAVAINPLLTDSAYRNLAIGQFNMWTPENEMKPQFIHPQPNIYSFKEADLLVNTALKNGIVVHGHALVFGEANPAWMQAAPLGQRKQIMVNHISTVVGHFKGRVTEWDVVNEPLSDDDSDYANNGNGLRQHIWYQAMGASYIDTAFQAAHAADPSAKLYLNDYGLEADGERWDALLQLITGLKARDVPINGIGFEAHVYDGSTDHIDPPTLERHIEQLAGLGLTSRIAEMDVHGEDPVVQANEYNGVLQACLNEPSCVDFATWGITDKYGSTTNDHEYPLDLGNDLLWDQNLRPKLAYTTLQSTLQKGLASQ